MNPVKCYANECLECTTIYPATTSGRAKADACCPGTSSRIVDVWQCACSKLWRTEDMASSCCKCRKCGELARTSELCRACEMADVIDARIEAAFKARGL